MEVKQNDQVNQNKYSESFRKDVTSHISKYTKPSWIISIWHTLITIIPLLYLLFCCQSLWLAPMLALMFVRAFIVFHDMAHNSFFPSRTCNYFGSLIMGTLVFTPRYHWTKEHNYHHKNSNKINRPQHAQTAAWDTTKYDNESALNKWIYKFTYGHYTLFSINPIIYFMVIHRFASKWYELLLTVIYVSVLAYYYTWQQYLYFVVAIWIAGVLGILLFHAQHTFDGVYRAYDKSDNPNLSPEETWEYFLNGIYGSSFLQVPFFLKFFTCGIEYHHIHHLNSRVPFYRLADCHNDSGELFNDVKRVTFPSILKTLTYSLYNISTKKFENVYHH